MNKKTKLSDGNLDEAIIPEDEQYYKLPENWVWVRLVPTFAECLDKYRKPVNATERAKRTGYVPYYGATGQVGWIDDYLTNEQLVILGEDGAPFLDMYKEKAYLIEGKSWVNNHAHILKSNFDSIGNKYLLNYLNQFNFHGYVSGTTRLKLTQKQMNSIPIPLPPINQMKQIVGEIDRLLSKIDEAKQLIEEAKETFGFRRASILDKAFRGELTEQWRNNNKSIEDAESLYNKIKSSQSKNRKAKAVDDKDIRFNLPHTWKWVHLGEVFQIKSGGTPKRTEPAYYEGEYPWIKTGEIKWNYIDNAKEHLTEEGIKNSSAKVLPKNSVVVAMYGQGLTRGRAAILNIDASCNQAVCALLPNDFILPEYIFYYFMEGYNRFRSIAKGGNQENLSATMISEFMFPLPPLEEQVEMVRLIKSILDKETVTSEYLNLPFDEIKQSILSKAFRGELGTNDSNDESAIELLKLVLQEKLN